MSARITLLIVLAAILAGCRDRTERVHEGIGAELTMTVPSSDPPTRHGKLLLAGTKLYVEFGPIADVYDASQKKGWRMYRESRQYSTIGEKQVSLWLPAMTDGSPCPKSQFPKSCKMVGKEDIEGRPSTHWQTLNQNGVLVHFWTDDRLQIAVRWQIERVTYEVSGIQDARVYDSVFELPPDYVPVAKD